MKAKAHVQLYTAASLLLAVAATAHAQQLPGDYSGVLGKVTVKVHISAASGGGYTGTLDSPAQHAFGLACSDVQMNGQAVSFQVPSVKGTFSGVISGDGSTIAGLWTQGGGSAMTLNLTREGGAGGAATQAAPVGQNAAPPPSSGSPASGCASSQSSVLSLSVRYWDSSTWQPMVAPNKTIDTERFDAGAVLRDPLHAKNIYTFPGPAASLTLGTNPKFCVMVPVSAQPNLLIGIPDIRRGNRQIEVLNAAYSNGALNQLISPHKQRAVNYERVSDMYVVVTPAEPLPPGQYLLILSRFSMLDFGVQ
jgi:hypothetical protein